MLLSCDNSSSAVNDKDTAATPNTTNYGGAGTGGVGAGYGAGGRAGADSNLPVGTSFDTTNAGNTQR